MWYVIIFKQPCLKASEQKHKAHRGQPRMGPYRALSLIQTNIPIFGDNFSQIENV